MVALTTLNLPAEAWKSARLLRAVPNCRLVLMMSYHMLSPALSVEEDGLMAYLQTPPKSWPVNCASYDRTAELEVCRRKVGGNWRQVANGHPAPSSFH